MPEKSPKLLLIGWDAADWKLIDPLLKQGKMPALQSLIQNGCRANIATLNPVLSPILWTSIATGKRSYDHGINGFVEIDELTAEITPVKGSSRKARAIWNILNQAGLKTNIINWWPSHPAECIDGVCVSNHYHESAPAFGEVWPMAEDSVYPTKLFDALKELRLHPGELTLAHVEPFIANASALDPETHPVLKPFMRVLAQCSSVHNAATFIMENTEWDFFAVYQEAIDHFSHLAMKYHPPKLEQISQEDFENFSHIMEGAYIVHDMMLERLISLAGPDCNIILLSDHGFESGHLRQLELPDIAAAPATEHRPYGVFVASGPDFQSGHQLYGMSLLDVVPNILHLFQLPIGEDMEGKVKPDLFKNPKPVSSIASWEGVGKPAEFLQSNSSSTEMITQLQELGYVELPDTNRRQYVDLELTYNRCVSLLDGNKTEEAVIVLEKYFQEYEEYRYGLLLAQAYHQLGKLSKLSDHLSEMEGAFPGAGGVLFLRGLLLAQQLKHQEAIEVFLKMEEGGVSSVQLFNQLGQLLLISGNIKGAKAYYDKALALDLENSAALSGRAHCNFESGDYENALKLAEQSLRLKLFQPNTHYILALSAFQLGYKEQGLQALQICLEQAPKHLGAQALMRKLNGERKQGQEIIVVSGFPRSGTSMMMKMLSAGGINIYSDHQRESDSHNPEGYYEHENVKRLGQDNSWIKESRGKAVKVISSLLRFLPKDEHYKLIWMKRPLTEVLLSQEKMKGRNSGETMRDFPFQKAVEMQNEEERMLKWIDSQPHMSLLIVNYYDCLENNNLVTSELSDFLNQSFNSDAAAEAINEKLHRNKLGKN